MSVHPCWRCECEKKTCDECITAKLRHDLHVLTGCVQVLLNDLPKCHACKERATSSVGNIYKCEKCRFPVCEDVPWKTAAMLVERLVKQ